MKLEVTKWFFDSIIGNLGKLVEIMFRLTLLVLPLWVYLLLIQSRTKVSSVSNISVYTNENSVWQNIYPGFILVSLNKDQLRNFKVRKIEEVQLFINRNKYILMFLFALIVVCLGILVYFKIGR